MSTISLRLPDDLMRETKSHAVALHLSQTEYIRNAIEHMNAEITRQQQKQRLIKASLRVRKESMRINAEFSRIEHDPET